MLLSPALGSSPHPPVSVYGTGYAYTIAAFLDGMDSHTSLLIFRSASRTGIFPRVFLWECLPRLRRTHFRLVLSFRVTTVLICIGTGISTCCPSDTSLDLSLGPDLPRADQLYPGNLGYSALWILTTISLLIPAFSLLNAPSLLIGTTSPPSECSPTDCTSTIPGFRCHV